MTLREPPYEDTAEEADSREQLREWTDLPKSETRRLIDFNRVDILTLESVPPRFILHVSGTKPYQNIDVRLVPLTYISRPEYWGIEVVGSLSGIGLPALTPYSVSLQLAPLGTPVFLGTRGIEVIGASRLEKHDLSIGEPQSRDLPAELFKHWIHSFEESTDNEDVYRPVGFDFPPAFGRRGLEIKENGEFVLHGIGPADGTVEVPGHWTATGASELSVWLEGRPPFTLTIVSVYDDMLRVLRDPTQRA
jgi:hypothetical protein